MEKEKLNEMKTHLVKKNGNKKLFPFPSPSP
jgi:hypothetical protein